MELKSHLLIWGEGWGISESALAFLRTLEQDYFADPEQWEGLILHGCGCMLLH